LEPFHIYFIAHPAESMRKKQKESETGANADGRTRNCPEMKRAGKFMVFFLLV
jgi:hypothetical protein